jgi:hypothetical protein
MTKNIYSAVIFILISVLHSCKNEKTASANSEETTNQSVFFKKIKELKQSDSLSIGHLEDVKIKFLFQENPEIDAEDEFRNETGYINLSDYKPLSHTDILNVTNNYALVLLRHKFSSELRAATFKGNGTPIETILLHDRLGNNEYQIIRTFLEEEAIDYSYDSKKNEFTFSDLRYDTEWITFPTQGTRIETYRIISNIGITEHGEFSLKAQNEL